VLLVYTEGVLKDRLQVHLTPVDQCFVEKAKKDIFAFASQLVDLIPDVLVVDISRYGLAKAKKLAHDLRQREVFRETVMIAIAPDDGETEELRANGFNDVFVDPFDAALLAERIRHYAQNPLCACTAETK
jgi:hypothetical protein